ncbi:MAG TPA: DinB family protein [candidate division Zixibacteria bacterium]|nr:DinB family protein [candidate division Zixibacteria bacterium]
MALKDAILPEFDHEMATTRKTLARVTAESFGWKPHAKSYSMLELASHLANAPAWTPDCLLKDSFEINTSEGEKFQTPQAESPEHLLQMFDENVAAARKAIDATSDEEFMKDWRFIEDGDEKVRMPKIAVLRAFILSHTIHHRAQLTVYLRMNDIPVPAIYGPSADEEN